MRQGQVQQQRDVQLQRLSPQQYLLSKLVELPLTDLEQRVRDELYENVALEEGVGPEQDEPDANSDDIDLSDPSDFQGESDDDTLSSYDSDDLPVYASQKSGNEPQAEIPIGDTRSFIEDLEKRWMRSGLAEKYGLSFETADNADARQARLERLKSEEGQCIYLAVYLRMLYLDYGSLDRDGHALQQGLETLEPEEQAYLAATAYNHGTLWRSPGEGNLDRIRSVAAVETFPLPKNLLRTKFRYYSYGDLAARYYRQNF